MNFDYNIFKKNKKLENIYLYYISNIKIEARNFLMLILFLENYESLQFRKFFIPDEFLKNFGFREVKELLKQSVNFFFAISQYVYCLFIGKIKSSFISTSFILKMESVINMNSNQRTKYLKNIWNDKNQELLKEISDFFQEYLEYMDSFIKENRNNLEAILNNVKSNYSIIKFMVKYNILNPFQFLSIIELYLNEILSNEDLNVMKTGNF